MTEQPYEERLKTWSPTRTFQHDASHCEIWKRSRNLLPGLPRTVNSTCFHSLTVFPLNPSWILESHSNMCSNFRIKYNWLHDWTEPGDAKSRNWKEGTHSRHNRQKYRKNVRRWKIIFWLGFRQAIIQLIRRTAIEMVWFEVTIIRVWRWNASQCGCQQHAFEKACDTIFLVTQNLDCSKGHDYD